MPKPVVTFVLKIDSFVSRMWLGLRWVTMMIIGVLIYAVIMRHGLNAPSVVAYELAMFTMTAGFIFAGGPLLLQEEHVRMDAFYSKWSPRKRAIVDVATFALFIYIIVLIFTSISATATSFAEGQHTRSIWGPPLWPLKAGMAVGCIILMLQAVANLIRDIATIRGKPLS
jgi:TRAP-type mannitol/chloroaromatic compound transport system permease small subunit